VSLAYFVKIALTKVRAQWQASTEMLMEFIEFSLLRMPEELEIKFKKWLPMIASMPIWLEEKTEDQYEWPVEVSDWRVDADEKSYIMDWCGCSGKERLLLHQNNLDKRIEALKIREFQLQIILVLEVLSLRREMGDAMKDLLEKRLKCQSKNQWIDIEQHLDVLVDRLCIWQALNDTHLLEDKNTDYKQDNDQLRQFCAEVIMPFYVSKLPDICNILSVKCGGPSLSHHALRLKRDKKKICTSTKGKQTIRAAKLSANSSKSSHVSTSCLATVLIDEKNKLSHAPTIMRFSSGEKHKGVFRDGILNSRQSLQHREIKMPLLKSTNKKGLDKSDGALSSGLPSGLSSGLPSSLEQSCNEKIKVPVKQNASKIQIQVLETPQKSRSVYKDVYRTSWSSERASDTSINYGSSESPVKKRQKVEFISETPLRKQH
ncbi:hypothetical protein PORY_001349, partial [Pneumocystis oryctolagi]